MLVVTRFLALAVFTTSIIACSTTTVLTPEAADYGLVISKINKTGARNSGTISFGTDTVETAQAIHIDHDTIRWSVSGEPYVAALSAVHDITFVDRSKGGLQGVLISLGIAVVTGGLTALSAIEEAPDGWVGFGVSIAGGVAALGVPAGLLIGVTHGYRETYYVPRPGAGTTKR